MKPPRLPIGSGIKSTNSLMKNKTQGTGVTLPKNAFENNAPKIPGWQVGLSVSILVITWCILWIYPWQPLLQNFIWLRLGIALVIFMVPGICLYGFFRASTSGWLNYLTFGFVISHLLWALAGIFGRFFHISFESIKNGMMAFSLAVLISFVLPRLKRFQFHRDWVAITRDLATCWPLVLTMILTGLMVTQRTISDDDLAYLAYITNWQQSAALDFNDVIFGAAKLTSVRFWIVSAPFAQAFLADIGSLSSVYLLGGFYEPFLVVLSLGSLYELARDFGLSRSAAMLGASAQIIFLALLSDYLHPGAPFFRQLSVDKAIAAFIVVPVFVQSVLGFLRGTTYKNIVLLLLTGLSLMTMHPVILLYAVSIVGLMALFSMTRSNIRSRILLLVLLLIILAPQIATRFVNSEAQGVVPYTPEEVLSSRGSENLIKAWGDTTFYGFHPSILAMQVPVESNSPALTFILQWGWLLIPLLTALFAIKNIRQDSLAQYILACFILVAFAGIPFTGWILGYFVSAWLLERTTWLYPYGIGMVFLGMAVGRSINFEARLAVWPKVFHQRTGMNLAAIFSTAVHIFVCLLTLLIMRGQALPNLERFENNIQRYQQFTQVGKFLDEHISGQAYVIGTEELNDYIPAISASAKVISYRPSDPSYPYFYSLEERNQRYLDRRAILAPEVSPEERLSLIQKYDIRFIWLKQGEYYMVRQLVSKYPSHFVVEQVGRYYLLEAR
jgi:hypothetical protein